MKSLCMQGVVLDAARSSNANMARSFSCLSTRSQVEQRRALSSDFDVGVPVHTNTAFDLQLRVPSEEIAYETSLAVIRLIACRPAPPLTASFSYPTLWKNVDQRNAFMRALLCSEHSLSSALVIGGTAVVIDSVQRATRNSPDEKRGPLERENLRMKV